MSACEVQNNQQGGSGARGEEHERVSFSSDKKSKGQFLDYRKCDLLILFCLFITYMIGGGFCLTVLPTLFMEFILSHWKLDPTCILQFGTLLALIGLAISSQAKNFITLLIANGIILGIGTSGIMKYTLNANYLFFLDKNIYLFMSIMNSGMGMGIIDVSLLYFWLNEKIGWRGIQLIQLGQAVPLIIFSIIFTPCIRKKIGLVGSAEIARAEVDNEESQTLIRDANFEDNEDKIHPRIAPNLKELFKGLFNRKFVCLWLSFGFAQPTLMAVITQQPSRMVQLGYSMSSGASSLAIQGAIQIAVRAGVGVVCSWNLLKPSYLSAFSKLTFAVFLFLCTFFTGYAWQYFLMIYMGIVGGIINTCDFIMVKDATILGREMGIALLLIMEGCGFFTLMYLVGYLAEAWGSYSVPFYGLVVIIFISFFFMILYEIFSRLPSRSSYTTVS